jgi:hypothetical protein
MAQITLTIPDNQLSRVLDAFSKTRPLGVNGTPTQPPAQILRQSLIAFVVKTVIQVEAEAAADNARRTAIESATSALTIT